MLEVRAGVVLHQEVEEHRVVVVALELLERVVAELPAAGHDEAGRLCRLHDGGITA